MFDMAEGRRAEGEDWRAYLGIRDDLNPEYICKSWSAVVAESAEYEVFAFLVKDQYARQHSLRNFSGL